MIAGRSIAHIRIVKRLGDAGSQCSFWWKSARHMNLPLRTPLRASCCMKCPSSSNKHDSEGGVCQRDALRLSLSATCREATPANYMASTRLQNCLLVHDIDRTCLMEVGTRRAAGDAAEITSPAERHDTCCKLRYCATSDVAFSFDTRTSARARRTFDDLPFY